MLHVYAVTDPGPRPPAVAGVDGAPVQTLSDHGLGVAYSRHDGAPSPPAPDTALAHGRVCDDLLDQGLSVLPVRYGTRYADEAALREGLAQRQPALAARLDAVRGCVELGLRVLWTPEPSSDGQVDAGRPAPDGGPGRAYLLRRLAQEQQRRQRREAAEATAAVVHEPLAAAAREARSEVLATPKLLLSAAYLVPRQAVEEFRALVDRVAAQRPDLEVLCTGPWPAYSFGDEPREARSGA